MHLHVHSHYSFLAGTLSIDRLLSAAEKQGHRSIALTDTNNVTGITEFYVRARERNIHPIIGAEVRAGAERSVLLAASWDAYQSICEILTELCREYPPARIREAEEYKEEAASSGERFEAVGGLASLLLRHAHPDLIVLCGDKTLLGSLAGGFVHENLFAELVPASQGRWPELLACAERLGIDSVATNDVYFGRPVGWKLHRMLRSIATNSTVGTLEEREVADRSQYFATEEEMSRSFRHLPEALEARSRIGERCRVEFDLSTSKFTSFSDESEADKLSFLRSLTEEGFLFRYRKPTAVHRERLEKEFAIIEQLGFVDYFLVAWDVVRYARHRNYPYVGRGSGANSIVAYCLRITNVDPIALDLFFERFLNPERRSPPDFDIDFSWRIRDDVISHVLEKYDPARTAMICTISTFNPRGALREVGKVLGYGEAEIKQWTSLISAYGSARDFTDPSGPFRRHGGIAQSSRYGREWIDTAALLLDFPNHYGIHSGGVILAPVAMTRYTATQIAPKGVRVTQQDMFAMEDWRLEKLDILSTRGLGTFEDTMRAVEVRTGSTPPIMEYANACADPRTREIMRTGRTIGCFYVESPAMIQLLKKLRTDTFEMLTAASSIIRPGVAQSGMMQAFIERYHDPRKIRPPHPLMAELLRSTFGVMVYQEDVIKVAHFLGNLSFGDADLLRRAMSGKMRSHEAMRRLRGSFFEGCRSRSIAESAIEEIWRQMESFAGYSFCKAHSASYAVLSFQEAYLKAYWPDLFLCSVLNNQGGYYRPDVYIQEAKRWGVDVLLPDVNASVELHACPREMVIQLGFLHVKGLTRRSMESILRGREETPYRDFRDFLARGGATPEDIAILVRCGACDCFGETRASMTAQTKLGARRLRNGAGTAELPLGEPDFIDELSGLAPYTPQQVTQIELDTFSYTVSTHVLSHFAEELQGSVKSADLERLVGRRVTIGGWMVAAKMTRTKKGERMMFINLDDATGMIDVVLFPKCYDAHAHLLRTAGPYRIIGRVAEEFGVINVVAEKVELLGRE